MIQNFSHIFLRSYLIVGSEPKSVMKCIGNIGACVGWDITFTRCDKHILQSIEDWFRELLVSGIMSNLSDTFDSVNNQVGQIASDVGAI